MRARDLAVQNFSVAEHLVQLYVLFRELILRRNQVVHRADRPDDPSARQEAEPTDGHGLRYINYAWVNQRVAIARNVVEASADVFSAVLEGLERQLDQEQERELARRTLTEGSGTT